MISEFESLGSVHFSVVYSFKNEIAHTDRAETKNIWCAKPSTYRMDMTIVGEETRVEWEVDNSMNVSSLSTKAWLIIVAEHDSINLFMFTNGEANFQIISEPMVSQAHTEFIIILGDFQHTATLNARSHQVCSHRIPCSYLLYSILQYT